MKISVLIPAYNAAKTIVATLTSVLQQTRPADEIIIVWDGGTDDTLERLEPFQDRITIVCQQNMGVAKSRNRLVQMAQGEMLAFLDNDDLWHPQYLEVQHALLELHPDVLASFTGHVNFQGADYVWREQPATDGAKAECIRQSEFFGRYYYSNGLFASMSYACVRRSTMSRLGPEPFQFSGVDDSYLFYRVSLLGGVVFFNTPLVAYRLSEGSLSANWLRVMPQWVAAFEKLEPEFQKSDVKELRRDFPIAYAGKRRLYARMLLGAGKIREARHQLYLSMIHCRHPASLAKSALHWAASLLPSFLQPKWPSAERSSAEILASSRTS